MARVAGARVTRSSTTRSSRALSPVSVRGLPHVGSDELADKVKEAVASIPLPKAQESPMASWLKTGSKRQRIVANQDEVKAHSESLKKKDYALRSGSSSGTPKVSSSSLSKSPGSSLRTSRRQSRASGRGKLRPLRSLAFKENDSTADNRLFRPTRSSPKVVQPKRSSQDSLISPVGSTQDRELSGKRTDLLSEVNEDVFLLNTPCHKTVKGTSLAPARQGQLGEDSEDPSAETREHLAHKTPEEALHIRKLPTSPPPVERQQLHLLHCHKGSPTKALDLLFRKRNKGKKKLDKVDGVAERGDELLPSLRPASPARRTEVDTPINLYDFTPTRKNRLVEPDYTAEKDERKRKRMVDCGVQAEDMDDDEDVGLFNCEQDVEVLSTLGEGTDGRVLEVRIKGRRVALKQTKLPDNQQRTIDTAWRQSNKELHFLSGLVHTCIAFERMDCRLSQYQRNYLGENVPFPRQQALYIVRVVCEGMKILHDEVRICHGDLAFRNILVRLREDKQSGQNKVDDSAVPFIAKISDFGRVKPLSEAPNYFNAGSDFNFLENVDVGLFGREILYRLFCGHSVPASLIKNRVLTSEAKDHYVTSLPDESRELLGPYYELCLRCVSDGVRPRFSEILQLLEGDSSSSNSSRVNSPLILDNTLVAQRLAKKPFSVGQAATRKSRKPTQLVHRPKVLEQSQLGRGKQGLSSFNAALEKWSKPRPSSPVPPANADSMPKIARTPPLTETQQSRGDGRRDLDNATSGVASTRLGRLKKMINLANHQGAKDTLGFPP